MSRLRSLVAHAAVVVALCAAGASPSRAEDTASPSVTGVADLKLSTPDHRVSLRLLFAASGEPARLRIEVVRAGTLVAVAWYDSSRLLVYAPTEGLLHEGPPTRATLEGALGLPFCPADVLYALRGGLPPEPPPCDAAGVARQQTGAGDEGAIELTRGGDTPTKLRFSRFRDVAGRPWPHRVTLDAGRARATVDIVAVGQGPLPPVAPTEQQLASARRVDAATLAARLGIDRGVATAPPGEGGLGR